MPTMSPRWLLLHGAPLSPTIWSAVADHLTGEVFAPDVMPGPDDGPDPQQAVARRLLQQLPPGEGRWYVVGHSFGGQVALDMALLSSHLISGLTVLCSRDTPFPGFYSAADLLARGAPVDTAAALQRWFRPAETADASPVVQQVRGYLNAADIVSWAVALRGIAAYDRSMATPHIAVPVSVVAAEHDVVSGPPVMQTMAQRIPRSVFTVLPGAAHMSAFLAPAELAAGLSRSAATTDL